MSSPNNNSQSDQTGQPLKLSIVIPCLNEAETIVDCVRQAKSALDDSGITGEVIVADNGSTDQSAGLAVGAGARVIPVDRRGYGFAVQAGIAAARGEYILMGDADGSYDFGQASKFVAKLDGGYDLVMGNRFRGVIMPGAMPWKNRYIGNPILTSIGRIFFHSSVGDFHSGLRAFKKSAATRMHLQTGGMEFATEMVIRAALMKMRITEIPITLYPDKRSVPPHLRPWRDGWRHLRFMLLFSPRWLFLYPGVLLVVVGAFVGVRLAFAPMQFGHITFDVHTLVFCSFALLIGAQAIVFAVFTKIFIRQIGLFQPDPLFDVIISKFSLEKSILSGMLLVLGGGFISIRALVNWSAQGFGPLSTENLLRLVVPGGTLLALGAQIIFSSLFLSILTMQHNRR